jgi:WD40 repeat protein
MSETLKPYPGPRPFAVGDSFFGRERELAELSQLSAIEQIVVLYGGQGSGKTSLVMAGLIPVMRREGYDVLPLGRVSGRTAAQDGRAGNVFLNNLVDSLDQDCHDPEVLSAMSLEEWLRAFTTSSRGAAEPAGELDGRGELLLLVIDRFEEIFSVYPEKWSEREEFFRELGAALNANPLLSVILCLREEYLAELDRYAEFVPGRLRVRYRIEPMGREAAVEAIRGPAAAAGRIFAPGAAEALVDSLQQIRVQQADGRWETVRGQYVDPLQLQLVCSSLWSSLPADKREVTLEDIASVRDVDSVIRAVYEAAIREALAAAPKSSISERRLRLWFDQELTSDAGTRESIQVGYEASAGLPNPVVYSLVDAHLLRLEVRSGATFVQLASDGFVDPVRAADRDWFAANHDPLVEAAGQWHRSGRAAGLLLAGPALASARSLARARPGDYGSVEKEFLELSEKAEKKRRGRARLRNIIIAGAVVLGLAMCLLTVLALSAWLYADNAKATAESSGVAARALLEQDLHPQLALLLAVEAANAVPPGQDVPPAVPGALNELLARIGGVPFQGDASPVWALAFSPDSAWVASGNDRGRIDFWDLSTGEPIEKGPLGSLTDKAAIYAAAVDRDGKILATGHADGTLGLWDVASGRALGEPVQAHPGGVETVTFSPDGSLLVTTGQDGLAIVWDAATGEKLKELRGHTSSISTVLIAPDGTGAITASEDGTGRFWDLTSDNPSEGSSAFGGDDSMRVVDIAISPVVDEMAVAYSDQTVGVYDFESSETLSRTLPQDAPVYKIWYRPDGKLVVVTGGSQSTAATVWDTTQPDAAEKVVGTLTRDVWDTKLSPDGTWLATQEISGTRLSLWDLTQPNPEAFVLAGHESIIWPFVFSPDSKWLVSGDLGGSVRRWDLDAIREAEESGQGSLTNAPPLPTAPTEQELRAAIELACRMAGRNLTEEEWTQYFPDKPYRETCPR